MRKLILVVQTSFDGFADNTIKYNAEKSILKIAIGDKI